MSSAEAEYDAMMDGAARNQKCEYLTMRLSMCDGGAVELMFATRRFRADSTHASDMDEDATEVMWKEPSGRCWKRVLEDERIGKMCVQESSTTMS